MSLSAILIDVRSPAECVAIPPLPDAINIEYTSISSLTENPQVTPDTNITLYCRSGRRSAIAETELKGLGFRRVRDLGAYEIAQAVLEKEEKDRGPKTGAMVQSGSDAEISGRKRRMDVSMAALLKGLRDEEVETNDGKEV